VPVELTLTPETRGRLSVYPVECVRRFGVDAFVTDRFAGVSPEPYDSLNLAGHVGDTFDHVAENRRRVADAAGVSLEQLVIIHQVHGREVLVVDQVPVDGEADALVSSSSGLCLAILVADCVPVLLVDEASPKFGVVHAGWRGLHAGVLASAVAHFDDPSTVHAFIGPSISVEGYQIGPEVAKYFDEVPGAVYPDGGDRSRLDLRHVTTTQLSELGLGDAHVMLSRQTTDGGETFFSDRAARPCGRFALVAKRAS
jgi:YfiH family protein